jgi:hypothetical protein
VPSQFAEFFQTVFTTIAQNSWEQVQKLIERGAAEISLARATYVEKACPSTYDILAPFLLGDGLTKGTGAYTPLALCQKTAELYQKGVPAVPCKDAEALIEKEIKARQVRGPALGQIAPGLPQYRYALALTTKGTVVAFGRFINLPRQVLILEAALVDNRPRITNFAWQPI